jgi:hypothetical protein
MNSLSEKTTQLEQTLTAYDDACVKLQSLKTELEKVQAHHQETRDNTISTPLLGRSKQST